MQTSRRGFFAALAAVTVASAVPMTKPVLRPATECDLAWVSLLDAMARVGRGAYVLRVHPDREVYARSILCRTFPKDDWRRDFTITPAAFTDLDTWALESPRAIYLSLGA